MNMNGKSMKAIRISKYGGIDERSYDTAPRPMPCEGEVLIRVLFTSVNSFDCAVRAGYMSNYFHYALPLILGTDVSGNIEEVGSGVSTFQRGDEVYARAGVIRDGSYAEYAVVRASDVAAKPHSLHHIRSAALPRVTLTAWQALFQLASL